MKILGDILLVLFIVSLLGVAGAMLLKEEGIAERLGNGAYLFLLAASLSKFIYHRSKDHRGTKAQRSQRLSLI